MDVAMMPTSHEFHALLLHSYTLSKFLPFLVNSPFCQDGAVGSRIEIWHKTATAGNKMAGHRENAGRQVETNGRRGKMTTSNFEGMTRRGLLGAFAATAVAAAPTYANAAGFLRRGGDIRRLRMYSGRTGESIDMIYWIDGKYIGDALQEINYFMRDWRQDEATRMDTRAIDVMAAAHNLLDVNEPYMLLSGYRTPQTNAMLRARSGGVARKSLHMKGQAADLRLNARSVSQMARAAAACKGGGVGRYSRSNFVHMDCGPVRTWGR